MKCIFRVQIPDPTPALWETMTKNAVLLINSTGHPGVYQTLRTTALQVKDLLTSIVILYVTWPHTMHRCSVTSSFHLHQSLPVINPGSRFGKQQREKHVCPQYKGIPCFSNKRLSQNILCQPQWKTSLGQDEKAKAHQQYLRN